MDIDAEAAVLAEAAIEDIEDAAAEACYTPAQLGLRVSFRDALMQCNQAIADAFAFFRDPNAARHIARFEALRQYLEDALHKSATDPRILGIAALGSAAHAPPLALFDSYLRSWARYRAKLQDGANDARARGALP